MDDLAAHLQPQAEQAEAYHSARLAAIEEQQLASVRFEEGKREKMNEVYKDKIGKRKQAKSGQGREKGDEVLEIFVPDIAEGETTTAPPSLATASPSAQSLAAVPYTITIQSSSTDSPWYNPAGFTYSDLETARAAGLWNYPSTPLQAARCLIFEDLWRKGHYMGGGLRFGGDFLIYPGASSPCALRGTPADLRARRRSPALPFPLYSYRDELSRLVNHATGSGRVRTTRDGGQEGALARELGREGGKGGLLFVGVGSIWLMHPMGWCALRLARLCSFDAASSTPALALDPLLALAMAPVDGSQVTWDWDRYVYDY